MCKVYFPRKGVRVVSSRWFTAGNFKTTTKLFHFTLLNFKFYFRAGVTVSRFMVISQGYPRCEGVGNQDESPNIARYNAVWIFRVESFKTLDFRVSTQSFSLNKKLCSLLRRECFSCWFGCSNKNKLSQYKMRFHTAVVRGLHSINLIREEWPNSGVDGFVYINYFKWQGFWRSDRLNNGKICSGSWFE